MSFFKKLFSKGEPAENTEPFIPTPSQQVPGLEPIVVQVIETLYPNVEDHKKVFEYSLKFYQVSDFNKKGLMLALLSVLCYSNGKIEDLIDLDSPHLSVLTYRILVDTSCNFSDIKAAEKWVKSITKLHV
jgi:hypothetical protein